MAMDMSRYPSDWREISKRIRFELAGNHCEWCGVPNGVYVCRKRGTPDYLTEYLDSNVVYRYPDGTPIRLSELPEGYDYDKPVKIVLTVAHLGTPHEDGTPGDKHDKMDVRENNLAALCQRCHLLYDIDEHVANRKVTMIRKRRLLAQARGQRTLFEVGS